MYRQLSDFSITEQWTPVSAGYRYPAVISGRYRLTNKVRIIRPNFRLLVILFNCGKNNTRDVCSSLVAPGCGRINSGSILGILPITGTYCT